MSWRLAAWAIAMAMLLPLLALGWTALRGSEGLWSHLFAYVLPTSARNTALLLGGGAPAAPCCCARRACSAST